MDIPVRELDVKCVECGKHFNVTTPKRMGYINVTCTHCHKEQRYMVPVRKIGEVQKEPTSKFETQMPVRVLGAVVSKQGRYIIENRAQINLKTSFICPKCNKPIAATLTSVGEQAVTCKDCVTKVFITAYDPEEEKRIRQEEEKKKQRAEALRREREEALRQEEALRRIREEEEEPQKQPVHDDEVLVYTPEPITEQPNDDDSNETVVAQPKPKRILTNYALQHGGGFLKQGLRYRLYTGTTIVGRRDAKTPSDIQFDDPEMSRRSVQLDVEMQNGMMTVSLTVLKDLNPVLINGHRLPQGMSVRLINGTKIKLGQTVLTFKKV